MEKLHLDQNDRIIVSSLQENLGQHDHLPNLGAEIESVPILIEAETYVQSLMINLARVLREEKGLRIDANEPRLGPVQSEFARIEARWDETWQRIAA